MIDAQDVVLGKLASKAAMLLMGKTKPTYTPFLDTGDHVIVINAAKVKLTGRKEEDKFIAISPDIPADWWRRISSGCAQTRPDPHCGRRHLRACFPKPSSANRCSGN